MGLLLGPFLIVKAAMRTLPVSQVEPVELRQVMDV
ncbi:hypothetical protein T4A_361 [Trichinella pseudospiralis]|uniref:Uncharacterized protein n=1 Tax=Trichinella pseudospiralis TaxID=6337 RepID=A0A0V1DS23_TRIPS|nr:hypothetical protein T4A_361 [Trichinella pseudospiralis]